MPNMTLLGGQVSKDKYVNFEIFEIMGKTNNYKMILAPKSATWPATS